LDAKRDPQSKVFEVYLGEQSLAISEGMDDETLLNQMIMERTEQGLHGLYRVPGDWGGQARFATQPWLRR
jgi:hypothetical protein